MARDLADGGTAADGGASQARRDRCGVRHAVDAPHCLARNVAHKEPAASSDLLPAESLGREPVIRQVSMATRNELIAVICELYGRSDRAELARPGQELSARRAPRRRV